jgi:hypothetical protein
MDKQLYIHFYLNKLCAYTITDGCLLHIDTSVKRAICAYSVTRPHLQAHENLGRNPPIILNPTQHTPH